jgi:hypothetical protein
MDIFHVLPMFGLNTIYNKEVMHAMRLHLF